MTSGAFSVPLILNRPTILLDDRANGLQLRFAPALHLRVPDASWLVGEKWGGLEVVRGSGLCLKIKLRWDRHRFSEAFVEAFGRWFSNAEMWTQLLFSTSLQVPGRMEPGEGELDVIVDLTRSTPTSAATELFLSTILPTASLVCITLDLYFCRKGLLRDHTSLPALQELMTLTDTALRNFWSKEVYRLAPIVGKVGYLEGMSEKAEYVDVVADTILRVAVRSGNEELKRAVGELEGSGGGVRKRAWRVLSDVLKGKKLGVRSRLKSSVETGGLVSENRVENFEDPLLFDEEVSERESGDEYEYDVFLDETETEEEEEEEEGLFTWSDGSAGEDEVDSIFNWMDENEYQEEDEVSLFGELENLAGCHGGDKNNLSLFEELEGLATGMGYHGDGKNELLFTEENELMLEDIALPCSEGEDMIWI